MSFPVVLWAPDPPHSDRHHHPREAHAKPSSLSSLQNPVLLLVSQTGKHPPISVQSRNLEITFVSSLPLILWSVTEPCHFDNGDLSSSLTFLCIPIPAMPHGHCLSLTRPNTACLPRGTALSRAAQASPTPLPLPQRAPSTLLHLVLILSVPYQWEGCPVLPGLL